MSDSIAERFVDWVLDRVMPWFIAALIIGIGVVAIGGAGYAVYNLVADAGDIKHGMVVDKWYTPAYKHVKGSYHPEQWTVRVYGPRELSRERGLEDFTVREWYYDEVKIGDKWDDK